MKLSDVFEANLEAGSCIFIPSYYWYQMDTQKPVTSIFVTCVLHFLCCLHQRAEAALLVNHPCFTELSSSAQVFTACANLTLSGTIPADLSTSFPLLTEIRLEWNVLTGPYNGSIYV